MKKRLLSLLCLTLVAAMLFTACGAPAASSAAPAAPAPADSAAAPADPAAPAPAAGAIEDGATLVYWPMWAETEPQGIVIAQAVEAFTADTGVEVEINWAGSRDTRKTLEPALAAGEVVDVFDEDIERVNSTWGKYLLDIQAMYDASPLNGAQNATLINLSKELGGGTMKSIPYQPSTFVTMYNKDAFTKAGITAVPKTWDEFIAACEALKGVGIIPLTVDDAYMGAFFGYTMDRIAGFEATKGVAAGDFTNPAILETAKVLEDMVKKGYIDPRAAGNVFPAGQNNIADGTVGMYLNGTWLPNEIKNQTPAGFKWGSFAYPGPIAAAGDGPEASQFGAQCFAINKDTKFPNASFALISFLTSGEWDQKLATDTFGVPMANDATWPDALADAKAVFDSTTKRLSWAVDMENDANVHATIKENFAKLISGTIDAQAFADAFAKVQKAA